MNRVRSLALVALLVLAAGCAMHPQRIVYDTLKAVKESEAEAMRDYYSLYWRGQVTADSEAQILKLHEDFTAVFQSAVRTASMDPAGAPAPPEVAAAGAAITQAVAILKSTPKPSP